MLVLKRVANGSAIRIAALELEDERGSLSGGLRIRLGKGGRVVAFLDGDVDDASAGRRAGEPSSVA